MGDGEADGLGLGGQDVHALLAGRAAVEGSEGSTITASAGDWRRLANCWRTVGYGVLTGESLSVGFVLYVSNVCGVWRRGSVTMYVEFCIDGIEWTEYLLPAYMRVLYKSPGNP